MSGYVCLKLSPPPTCLSKHPRLPIPLVRNTLLGAALSFGLVFSFPSVSASQICRDVEPIQETLQTAPEVVTNEGLVEEAWQIVNDTFLDTGRHRWSQDTWQVTNIIYSYSHSVLWLVGSWFMARANIALLVSSWRGKLFWAIPFRQDQRRTTSSNECSPAWPILILAFSPLVRYLH